MYLCLRSDAILTSRVCSLIVLDHLMEEDITVYTWYLSSSHLHHAHQSPESDGQHASSVVHNCIKRAEEGKYWRWHQEKSRHKSLLSLMEWFPFSESTFLIKSVISWCYQSRVMQNRGKAIKLSTLQASGISFHCYLDWWLNRKHC